MIHQQNQVLHLPAGLQMGDDIGSASGPIHALGIRDVFSNDDSLWLWLT